MLGTAPVALDASGNASLAGVTLPEGTVTITATTDNIPNRGVGTGTATVTVDMAPPTAPDEPDGDRRRPSQDVDPADLDRAQRQTAPASPATRSATRRRRSRVELRSTPRRPGTYTGRRSCPPVSPTASSSTTSTSRTATSSPSRRATRPGNLSPLIGTTTAVTAHFNTTMIPSPSGTNQSFGVPLDGSQDVNGDGISDLLVGTFNDNHAYLFLGGATFAPSGPSRDVHGREHRLRRNGPPDRRHRRRWPAGHRHRRQAHRGAAPHLQGPRDLAGTLTDTQADYVVTTDATFAGSQFGIVDRSNRRLRRRRGRRLRGRRAAVQLARGPSGRDLMAAPGSRASRSRTRRVRSRSRPRRDSRVRSSVHRSPASNTSTQAPGRRSSCLRPAWSRSRATTPAACTRSTVVDRALQSTRPAPTTRSLVPVPAP